MSHYYTKPGPTAKWNLPIIYEYVDPELKPCERAGCSKQIPFRDGATRAEYKKRKYCSSNCQSIATSDQITLEVHKGDIIRFKVWLKDNGYRLKAIQNGFQFSKDYRYHSVHKQKGRNYKFMQGAIKLFNEHRSSAGE